MKVFKSMNPQPGDIHIDQLLTNLSIGYRNPSYIADAIFPVVNVKKQSDRIPKYDQSHWFRDEALVRAMGTRSRGAGFTVNTSSTYFCDRYSWRNEIADEQRDNQDAPFNVDRDGLALVNEKMALNRERALATFAFTTGLWGTDVVGGTNFNKWSDYGASTPLVDIAGWQETVEGKIALEPMDLVIGRQVWTYAKWHPDFVDTIKYTQTGKVTLETILNLTDLTRIHVGRALYTTSAPGVAEGSATYARVWGAHALLLYVPSGPSLMTPAAGYTFVWDRVAGALQYIKRMRDEEREVDIIEGNSYYDHVVTEARAGLFAQTVV